MSNFATSLPMYARAARAYSRWESLTLKRELLRLMDAHALGSDGVLRPPRRPWIQLAACKCNNDYYTLLNSI